jgi:ribonuclease Z
MSWLVQPRLINDPFGDPGLFLDFRYGRRALLFDLGDLGPLSARELMRVSHAFVSHTHIDHFAGFDRLLRTCLHRAAPLHLFGPPGFIDQVEHRLRAFTWNLLGPDSVDFRIRVREVHGGRAVPEAEFRARDGFTRRDRNAPDLREGVILAEGSFCITARTLDHGVPSLAFALRETTRVNVQRGALENLRLPVGPWLNAAKEAVRQQRPDDTVIAVPGARTLTLGDLKARALRTGPGQVVAYVTDAAFNEDNRCVIRELAWQADQLFIEAVFLEQDAALAAATRHLTAAQAGALAREAGVRRMTPFHFSARYLAMPEALRREAEQAFGGPATSDLDERTMLDGQVVRARGTVHF